MRVRLECVDVVGDVGDIGNIGNNEDVGNVGGEAVNLIQDMYVPVPPSA